MEQQVIPEVSAPQTATKPNPGQWTWGTGRRKKSVARVRIRPGSGQFLINKRQSQDFFRQEKDQQAILVPLEVANAGGSIDVHVNVVGGGPTGQAGAVSLGLARALARLMPESESRLRNRSLLTRDARMKERKKYGQKGARKRFQFSKR